MATWGEIKLGSNSVSDSSGVIVIDGAEVVGLELGTDGRPLLHVDVYGPGGKHIAKLWRNSWVFGNREDFVMTRTADHVSMTEKATGRVIVDARLAQHGKPTVAVTAADLYGPKGLHVNIDADGTLHAGGVSLSGNTINGFGKAIVVGSTGIGSAPAEREMIAVTASPPSRL
jgi:hypothetical protein